jgi:molecular chaperone GrpE
MTQKGDDFLAPITAAELPTPAWDGQAGDLQATLEQDLRLLLRSLAEARLELEEAGRRQEAEKREWLLAALDISDAFDRVFHNVHTKDDQITPQMKKWLGNFGTVRRKLETLLAERGVNRIQSLDDQFDPQWHRIVDTVRDMARADGTIIEEINAGYFWNRTLLRKAEVVVVRNEG